MHELGSIYVRTQKKFLVQWLEWLTAKQVICAQVYAFYMNNISSN